MSDSEQHRRLETHAARLADVLAPEAARDDRPVEKQLRSAYEGGVMDGLTVLVRTGSVDVEELLVRFEGGLSSLEASVADAERSLRRQLVEGAEDGSD